jgi:hypothetical protein
MSEDQVSKKRRLNNFRRSLPHVSAPALSAVLEEVSQGGMPELTSKWELGTATSEELEANTPYGKVSGEAELIAKSGGMLRSASLNPFALPYRAFSRGGGFCRMLIGRHQTCSSSPEAPWQLVMHIDEVVPGTVVNPDNRRKVWVVYFSFP